MRAQVRRIRYVKTQNLNTGTQRIARKSNAPASLSKNADTRVGYPSNYSDYGLGNLNKSIRLPMAGVFRGTWGLLLVAIGLGRLSRLRSLTGEGGIVNTVMVGEVLQVRCVPGFLKEILGKMLTAAVWNNTADTQKNPWLRIPTEPATILLTSGRFWRGCGPV
jgi:hypothetical protein